MSYIVPIYQPSLGGNEKLYVNECIDSTWISSKGRFITLFEQDFASYTGTKYATSVCNGTVALHLALVALGIGQGDEVIVPTLTYISSANAITYTGARPIFVDSLENTWQIDPADVGRKITDRTKAIIVVHLYGHPCAMDDIMEIARTNNLFVVEDCAEAVGSYYKGKHVGNFGHISTYSFFGNKTITTGEGGMVVTNDETLYDRAIHYKGQGLVKHREYWHDVIGYNFRMTNICAAIGLAQLEQADKFLARKRHIAHMYKEKLSDLPIKVHEESPGVTHSYWMSSVIVDNPTFRDPLREALKTGGVETRPLFNPIHTMPMYSQNFQQFPVAESLGWRGINLPSWPDLKEEQENYICEVINNFFNR